MSHSPIVPLECLRAGEWAEVHDVCAEPAVIGRMAELGLRAGSRVRVLRGGSPCLVQVEGARLSYRAEEGMVLVRPIAS